MRIADFALQLQSRHEATSRREFLYSSEVWSGERWSDIGSDAPLGAASNVQVSISDAGHRAASAVAVTPGKVGEGCPSDAAEADPRLSLVRALVEMLTGRQIKVIAVEPAGVSSAAQSGSPDAGRAAAVENRGEGWGIRLDYREVHEETEFTSLCASGLVRTMDGREIVFDFGLSMSRSYREEVSISLRGGDARQQDPLVIGLDGAAPQVTSGTFHFDLNGDGRVEDVPRLSSGSGYLALDSNGNGTVDSGTELFGPATGNGFGELAAYDRDSNGWIDEGDAVFCRLRLWQPASDGWGELTSLGDAGVGALSLAAVETPFQFRSASNGLLGTLRASAVYLGENGAVGPLQHIDLVA